MACDRLQQRSSCIFVSKLVVRCIIHTTADRPTRYVIAASFIHGNQLSTVLKLLIFLPSLQVVACYIHVGVCSMLCVRMCLLRQACQSCAWNFKFLGRIQDWLQNRIRGFLRKCAIHITDIDVWQWLNRHYYLQDSLIRSIVLTYVILPYTLSLRQFRAGSPSARCASPM